MKVRIVGCVPYKDLWRTIVISIVIITLPQANQPLPFFTDEHNNDSDSPDVPKNYIKFLRKDWPWRGRLGEVSRRGNFGFVDSYLSVLLLYWLFIIYWREGWSFWRDLFHANDLICTPECRLRAHNDSTGEFTTDEGPSPQRGNNSLTPHDDFSE